MEKREIKRFTYNHDDSGKVFLLALLLPFVLSFVFSFIAGQIATMKGVEGDEITSNIWFNLVYSVAQLALIVGIWLFYNKRKGIAYSAIKLNYKQKWHTYLVAVGVGIVALFGLQYLVGAFENLFQAVGYPISQEFGSVDPENVGEYFYAVLTLALIPAFTEELLFRGVILNGLRERFKDVWAVVISALMFALMHQNLQQLIYPILLGCLLAWIVIKTGSTFISMIVHFVNNFLVVTFRYIDNATGFSFNLPNTWWFYLVAIALAVATFGICCLVEKFYFKNKKNEEIEKSSSSISPFIFISCVVGAVLFIMNTALYVISL